MLSPLRFRSLHLRNAIRPNSGCKINVFPSPPSCGLFYCSLAYLQSQLIAKLPEIAQHLPTPQEQRTTIISSSDRDGLLNPLSSFLVSFANPIQDFFTRQTEKIEEKEAQEFTHEEE